MAVILRRGEIHWADLKNLKLSDLKDIVHNLPRLEDDGEAFARDIARLIEDQPPIRTSPCEPGGIDDS